MKGFSARKWGVGFPGLGVTIFLFVLFSGTHPGSVQAAPGALDLDFGNQGLALTVFGDSLNASSARAVAIQSDGKIVAAGVAAIGSNSDFGLVRYNTDGSLDATFNPSGSPPGTVMTDVSDSGAFDEANAMVLQPDGKIVVAGTVSLGGNNDFALARYDTNGGLDPTFNPSGSMPGTVTTDFPGSGSDIGTGVAVQLDGKIVVVGFSDGGGSEDFAVARYNTNGVLDDTFNPSGSLPGTVATDFSGSGDTDTANAVAIQPDGRIVVGGNFFVLSVSNDFALARYDTNGNLDPTFNPSGSLPGTVITDISGGGDQINAVAIQLDGKIIAAGGPDDFALARYDTNGSLDPTFNSSGSLPGTVTTDLSRSDLNDEVRGVTILADGKIVAAGVSAAVIDGSEQVDFAVARYNSEGTLDTTFGSFGPTPGFVVTDFSGLLGSDETNAVAIQPDGKIVTAGSEAALGGTGFVLVRYQGNSSDLSITKTASASSAQVGDEVTYTITVKNSGPQSADGIVVTDILTGAVSFGSISASQGSCSGTNDLTCNLGALANGASATVTVPVTTTAAGGISNIASVKGQGVDPDPTNNLALAFVNISGGGGPAAASANLSITKTASPPSPRVGDTVTYTLTVTNQGPDSADGVVVTDALFGSFSDLSASSTQGVCTVNGPVTCNVGTLGNSASVTVTVTLKVGDFGPLSNLATVISQASDPDLSNNSAAVNLTITTGSASGGGCALNPLDGVRGGWAAILLSLPIFIGLRRWEKRSSQKGRLA